MKEWIKATLEAKGISGTDEELQALQIEYAALERWREAVDKFGLNEANSVLVNLPRREAQ